jgi:branched-chain amino acid transport system substrate-binding protein
MKNAFHLLFLISIVFWAGGCDTRPAVLPSGKTIKVGIIAPFSGPKQTKGEQGLAGIETARQLQPYLQNGGRVELILENDENNPVLSVKALQKLVAETKVSAIITFSDSNPVLAMASIADAHRTPILAVTATHPEITRGNRYISQLCFDDDFQGTVAALFVRDELLIDKVALFRNPASAYSTYLASKFESKFTSIGGEITDRIDISADTHNLSQVVKSLHAKTPELLYLPIRAEDVLRVSKETHKLGWKPKIMGSDGLISYLLARYREEVKILDGLLTTDFFVASMPLTPFGKKAKREHRGPRSTFAALGVEGYTLLLEAMNRCQDPEDRECVNHQIRSTVNFTGLAGKVTIGPDGKAQRPLFIESIQAGQSEFIAKVY